MRSGLDVYLPSFRAALLRCRKVRRCNLSLTKTMTQFPLRWSGTTKQKSCPLLVFKPDEPLNEPYQLHVQLLYVPHSFRGINWLRRRVNELSGLLEGWRWLPIYGPSFGECKDIKQVTMQSFSYIEGLFDVSPQYCSYTFCLCSLLVVVAGASGSFSV